TDGRNIAPVGATRSWDTPIPITATGVNWRAVAYSAARASTFNTNRICGFCGDIGVSNGAGGTCLSPGQFANCGGTVGADGSAVSTVFVPINGAAYSQSSLFLSSPADPLIQIRAF